MHAHTYAVEGSWRSLFKDLGVRPADVLRRAGLPEDLLSRPAVRLSSEAFFRFWDSLDAELGDPLLPIRLCTTLRAESFSPALFAALCSPNYLTAVHRIQKYKSLVAPMRILIDESADQMTVGLEWLDKAVRPPVSLVAMELVFFVQLARLGTREMVRPIEVRTPVPPAPAKAYEDLFGVRVREGDVHRLTFSRADAARPFLTSNEGMWEAFEPELRRRLAELDETATVGERVRAALLESLPGGQASMESVAQRLALSKRTLQRRLEREGTSYQKVLQDTRESLAKHYLQRTKLAPAEISFLLGFEEPSSFYRAFSDWTGQTPETLRQAMVH
ncbi:MAG: AraC family transcriptional regulator ligand-binding domain-containing protein [Polyangiaceae bacterium]